MWSIFQTDLALWGFEICTNLFEKNYFPKVIKMEIWIPTKLIRGVSNAYGNEFLIN